MLRIILEYRKGILFVRLIGDLDKDSVKKFDLQVVGKIKKSGIYNVVFNIEKLKFIDLKGMNYLLYSYELCKNNNGKIFICGLSDNRTSSKIKKNRLLNYLEPIDNEINAFKLVKI